jgi:O-methyltransferase
MKTELALIRLCNKYLDLLIKILINFIYEDGSIHPGGSDSYVPSDRAEGRDWPRFAHTMAGAARLNNLKDLVLKTIKEKIPGHYIETGVWRGGCCILMKGIISACRENARKVYVADSFEGLPPPKADIFPADLGDDLFQYKELAISLEQVKANFAKYDLLDANVVFVKGFFDITLPKLKAGPFALIRLDGDMYESTIVALENLYPKLSPGGFVIVDDYALPGCKKAVDDFRVLHKITTPLKHTDWTGIWWRKPKKLSAR